jgi:hypothetical protein
MTLEALIGDDLREFGYSLATDLRKPASLSLRLGFMRMFYPWYFESKVFLKSKTALGRFLVKGGRLELTASV